MVRLHRGRDGLRTVSGGAGGSRRGGRGRGCWRGSCGGERRCGYRVGKKSCGKGRAPPPPPSSSPLPSPPPPPPSPPYTFADSSADTTSNSCSHTSANSCADCEGRKGERRIVVRRRGVGLCGGSRGGFDPS